MSFRTLMRYLDPAFIDAPEAGRSLPEAGGARSDSVPRPVTMRNGRAIAPTSLDREGFVLLRLTEAENRRLVALGDPFSYLTQRPADRSAHHRVFEEAVMRATGACYVRCFNFVLRRSSIEGVHTLPSGDDSARGAVNDVHTDFTPDAPALRNLAALAESLGLAGCRQTVLNCWRNAASSGPVRQWPMAVCDASSVRPEELVARVSPENGNRIHNLLHSARHAWCYFPRMRANEEALLFKQWDTDERWARFTPHTAFNAPREGHPAAAPAPARESCEVRLVCFFAEEGGVGGGGRELSEGLRRALRELDRSGVGLVSPAALEEAPSRL